MDLNADEAGHYVVIGSDGRIIQPLQGVTIKNDNVYQYVMSSGGGSSQHIPVITIGPNGKLTPVREKMINMNNANTSPVQSQGLSDSKSAVVKIETELSGEMEGHLLAEEKPQSNVLKHEIQKEVKGDQEVECAKSCRVCCDIDGSELDKPNTSAPRTWGCARCGAAGTSEAHSSNNTVDEKTSNNFPLVLGLVPAANQKTETSPKGRFQCKVCLKLFTQKVNLTTHERIHLGERPYQCKVCLKAFTQQSNLVTHERIHTGERPYQCQVCLKRFTQRQNLTAHERIHLGERPFQCQVCQKAFTQRQNLVAHERIHLGERPYQCQVCLKSFTQQQNLTAHERIHTGYRQFSCTVCQKSFTQEQNLTKHMLTHTGEKPYSCQFCNKSFAQQSNLTTHERTHLGNPSVSEGPGRKRKVFVYTQEQLLTSQLQTQQSDTEVTQTEINTLFPSQRSQ